MFFKLSIVFSLYKQENKTQNKLQRNFMKLCHVNPEEKFVTTYKSWSCFFPATDNPLTIFELGILVEWILTCNHGYALFRRHTVLKKIISMCVLQG